MKKIMVLGKSIPLIAVLITSLLTSTVLGAYVGHFLMTRPASVTVTMNGFEASLYADAGLTTPLASLSFPEAIQGDISGSTTDTTCYIALTRPSEIAGLDVRALWRCPDLPAGMTLTAKWLYGADWLDWNEGVYSLTLSVDYVQRQICFTLDIGNAGVGDYSFTVEIEVGEWS